MPRGIRMGSIGSAGVSIVCATVTPPRAAQLDLAAQSDEQLISRLSGPNIYFRETAQPLLTDVLHHCGPDKLLPAIVWPNLHPLLEPEGARFAVLLHRSSPAEGSAPAVATLMRRAIERVLSARDPDFQAVAALLEYTARV